jgi:hypothetical protein
LVIGAAVAKGTSVVQATAIKIRRERRVRGNILASREVGISNDWATKWHWQIFQARRGN